MYVLNQQNFDAKNLYWWWQLSSFLMNCFNSRVLQTNCMSRLDLKTLSSPSERQNLTYQCAVCWQGGSDVSLRLSWEHKLKVLSALPPSSKKKTWRTIGRVARRRLSRTELLSPTSWVIHRCLQNRQDTFKLVENVHADEIQKWLTWSFPVLIMFHHALFLAPLTSRVSTVVLDVSGGAAVVNVVFPIVVMFGAIVVMLLLMVVALVWA